MIHSLLTLYEAFAKAVYRWGILVSVLSKNDSLGLCNMHGTYTRIQVQIFTCEIRII
jgi:hypothetical protein